MALVPRRVWLRAFLFWCLGASVAYIFCYIFEFNNKELSFIKTSDMLSDMPQPRKQPLKSADHYSKPEAVKLLIMIFSQPESFHLRQTIRDTWLSHGNADIAHIFVIRILSDKDYTLINYKLSLENQYYNDTLFINDGEHSINTYTSKLLLVALTWGLNHVKFKYLLKCNDVSYVAIDKLMKSIPKGSWLIWGYFMGNENVTRTGIKAERKWNLCTKYLPYPQGGGYVISKDIVEFIIEMGPYFDHTDHEDIGLAVWLSPLKNITRHHDISFNTGTISRGCLNHYIISHPETVESIINKHALLNQGQLCHEEKEFIPSYQYNWSAPVTDCCN